MREGDAAGNLAVLVAEDDSSTRELLKCLLDGQGYVVMTAANGAEAWARLQEAAAPRLVLLDWHLPDLTGGEICQRLRSKLGSRDAYVIILSGDNDSASLDLAMAAGADAYLAKPFELDELFASLDTGRRKLRETA